MFLFVNSSTKDDADTCTCSQFLGREPQEVDKVLLADTNRGLIQGIGDAVEGLALIKELLKSYDPNTRYLEDEIIAWIKWFQDFMNLNLNPFAGANLSFLKQLQALPPSLRSVRMIQPR